jgi:hypothetical protein
MPLVENTKRIFDKYDRKSYSSDCNTYMQADEQTIVCIVVNEKERTKGVDVLMEQAYKHKPLDTCIRKHFVGESLKDFDLWLSKIFKRKEYAKANS